MQIINTDEFITNDNMSMLSWKIMLITQIYSQTQLICLQPKSIQVKYEFQISKFDVAAIPTKAKFRIRKTHVSQDDMYHKVSNKGTDDVY